MIETCEQYNIFFKNRDKGEKQMIKDMQPFLQQAWEKAGFKELTEIQNKRFQLF